MSRNEVYLFQFLCIVVSLTAKAIVSLLTVFKDIVFIVYYTLNNSVCFILRRFKQPDSTKIFVILLRMFIDKLKNCNFLYFGKLCIK